MLLYSSFFPKQGTDCLCRYRPFWTPLSLPWKDPGTCIFPGAVPLGIHCRNTSCRKLKAGKRLVMLTCTCRKSGVIATWLPHYDALLQHQPTGKVSTTTKTSQTAQIINPYVQPGELPMVWDNCFYTPWGWGPLTATDHVAAASPTPAAPLWAWSRALSPGPSILYIENKK